MQADVDWLGGTAVAGLAQEAGHLHGEGLIPTSA